MRRFLRLLGRKRWGDVRGMLCLLEINRANCGNVIEFQLSVQAIHGGHQLFRDIVLS